MLEAIALNQQGIEGKNQKVTDQKTGVILLLLHVTYQPYIRKCKNS